MLGTPVGSGPIAVAFSPTSGDIYVANFASDNVSILNGGTGALVATLVGFDEPTAAIFDPALGDILIANEAGNNVTLISSSNSIAGTVNVGTSPVALTYDAVNEDAYVSNGGASTLSSITSAGAAGPSITLWKSPAGVAYDSQNGKLYVVVPSTDQLAIYDPVSGKFQTNVTVGTGPYGVAVDLSSGTAYVTDGGEGGVSAVNTTTDAVTTYSVGGVPRNILFDPTNGNVYATLPGSDEVAILNPGWNGWISSSSQPVAIAIDTTSNLLYVANYASESVTWYSLSVSTSVTFTESGLPASTSWTVAFEGQNHTASTASISLSAANATYPYSIEKSGGYVPTPSGGTITVSGTAVHVGVVFNLTYALQVSESGLPAAMAWWISIGGSNYSTSSTSVRVELVNGSYGYEVGNPLPINTWEQYVVPSGHGSVLINGKAASITLVYTVQYYLSVFVNNPVDGGTSTLSGWYNGGSTVVLDATPTLGYALRGWVGSGPAAYTGPENPYSLVMNGSANETADFGAVVSYVVTFTESGLPTGTSWSITILGHTPVSGPTPTLTIDLPNGTYFFSVTTNISAGTGIEYRATPASSSVAVSGNSSQSIAYGTYFLATTAVSPSDSGLITPPGYYREDSTFWLNATPASGWVFSKWVGSGNGSYSGPKANATATAEAPIKETAYFLPLYTISFEEVGLPVNSSWTVTLNGTAKTGTGKFLNFSEVPGSYSYTASGPSKYSATPSRSTTAVSSAPVVVKISFVEIAKPASTILGLTSTDWIALFVLLAVVVVLVLLFTRKAKGGSGEEPPAEPAEEARSEMSDSSSDQPYEIISPTKKEEGPP